MAPSGLRALIQVLSESIRCPVDPHHAPRVQREVLPLMRV
jgi:hypothetical protein